MRAKGACILHLKLVLLFTVVCALVSPKILRAAESVELNVTPFSTTGDEYPNAFNGMGVSLSLNHYYVSSLMGVGVNFLTQGSAQFFAAYFRYYLKGQPPVAPVPLEPIVSGDVRKPSMVINTRGYSLSLQVGAAAYKVSRTLKTTQIETNSGYGGIGGVQFEYPLFSRFYGIAKVSYFTSYDGPAESIISEIGLSFPFDF